MERTETALSYYSWRIEYETGWGTETFHVKQQRGAKTVPYYVYRFNSGPTGVLMARVLSKHHALAFIEAVALPLIEASNEVVRQLKES